MQLIIFCRLALLVQPGLLNSILYCSLKSINAYIFESFEPDAIPAHARLAQFFTIRLGQIGLIIYSKDNGLTSAGLTFGKLKYRHTS